MTSPLPPKRRDTRSTFDLIRQDRTRLTQLDRGLVNGRYPPARPLGPRWDDDAEDDFADETLYEWEWDDRGTIHGLGGAQTFRLSNVPVEESLFVRWHPDGRGGLPITNEHFFVIGQNVTIADPGVFAVGDEFSFQYQYDPGIDPEPVTFIPRGWVHNDVTLPVHLPAGTALGDTILVVVFNQRGWVGTVTDPRLTLIGSSPVHSQIGGDVSAQVWMGTATDLSDIGVTGPSPWVTCAVAAFAGYIGHGATSQTSAVGAPYSAPTLPVEAAIMVAVSLNGTVTGVAPTPNVSTYSLAAQDTTSDFSVASVLTYLGDAPTPTATMNTGGGDGQSWTLLIEAQP